MSVFDIFKKKSNKAPLRYAPTMSGGTPFYSSFGDNIYASDIIVQAIRCKSNEFKKLDPRHIRNGADGQTVINDSYISKILYQPNPLMTAAEFLEKITILLELNKNVYIYPTFYISNGGEKIYTGLYPLKPTTVEYLVDEKNKLYIKFTFANGYVAPVLPANEIIHWKKDYGVNDYFGGNPLGFNENLGLLKMLQRYDELTQSIAKALKVSCTINGVVRYNSYNDDADLKAKREQFEEDIKTNQSGILFTDLKTEYQHIPRDIKLVDKDTLEFFYQVLLRNTGVSLAILNGDYTKEQKEAFYEHALEGDIKALGQVMTKRLFTDRELSFGNQIVLYPNDITFMSMTNKLRALQIGLPAGIFTKDEARELIGYPPLPNGEGKVMPQGYNNLLGDDNQNKLKNDDEDEDKLLDDDDFKD